jgi:hypothetical protein
MPGGDRTGPRGFGPMMGAVQGTVQGMQYLTLGISGSGQDPCVVVAEEVGAAGVTGTMQRDLPDSGVPGVGRSHEPQVMDRPSAGNSNWRH